MSTKRERQKKAVRYTSAKERAEKREAGFEPTTFSIPEGKSKFYFNKAGVYRLDVLPYVVGKGNPFSDEGMMYYERTFFVHNQIGPDNERLVCPKKTFGKPCPVCEYATKARRDPSVDKDFLKELQPKERQLWNVIDLNNPSKGVQIMDQPTFFFGKLIDAKIKDADEDDNFENFFHLEGGMSLKVSVEESSFNGISFYKPSNIEMKPRKKDYGEEILDEVMCLDSLLKDPDYKTMKKLFLQMVEPMDNEPVMDDEDEDDNDSPPATSSRKVLEIDDDEDDDDEEEDTPPPAKKGGKKAPSLSVGDRVIYEELEAEVIKISKDGTSLTLKDEEGEIHTAVGPDEVEVSFSIKDKPVEKPKESKPRRGAKPPVDDDDDDDDMDDDNMDEDDDMEMDDDDDDDEEDEDIPPPPRRRGRPPRK